MNRRKLLKNLALAAPAAWLPSVVELEPAGPAPLSAYLGVAGPVPNARVVPRDAKFGLWAHWGPQCQPERGDWYARGMYQEESDQYKFHVEKYGHPSKFGFKDVINEWKAA